jgi:hypothetical protein
MRRYFVFMLAAAVLGGSIQTSADEPISITIRPLVANFGGTARVKVLVARNDANRSLIWEMDGPNYYRSSAMQLDGASSPRTYFFLAKNLPSGEFEIRVTVRRTDNSVLMDRGMIRVVGGPE